MSHVTSIEVVINDLDALERAAARCGLELVRGQTTYRWWGRSVGDYPLPEGFSAEELGACEHALRIPGDDRAYEIGVVRRRDGKEGFTLLWDFFAGGYGLEDKVGENANRLRQSYSLERVIGAARAAGQQVGEPVWNAEDSTWTLEVEEAKQW